MKFNFRAAIGGVLMCAALPVSAVVIDTNGKFAVASEDGTFAMRLSGRIHADANFYKSDVVDHTSGAFIRRARIGVNGYVRNWDYMITFDNATDEADLKDAYLARQLGPGRLIIGQFKQFQGFDETTSSNDIVFIERTHVSNAMTARAIGVGYHGTVGGFGYAASVYNLREASDGASRAIDDGIGGVVSGYVAPFNAEDKALHLGLTYAYEATDQAGGGINLRPLGRSNEGRFTLFDVAGERADIHRVNLTLAGILGPFAGQAEWLTGSVDADNQPDDDFTAYYGQLSYAMTGGTPRSYDFAKGRVRNPKAAGGSLGAIEVAVRYQYAERQNVGGAELTTVEAGLNYYVNNNVRFMLNYGLADNDVNGDEAELLSLRAQFAF